VGGYKICEVEYQVGEWNAGGGVVKVVSCCVRCGRFVRVARANRGGSASDPGGSEAVSEGGFVGLASCSGKVLEIARATLTPHVIE
jgi:hypothetical protein